MARSVKEWIGKTDDTPVPPRVRLRVLERYNFRCDGLLQGGDRCGNNLKGQPWTCDHDKALINGGENRESNLHPLGDKCCNPKKNKADVAEKSASYHTRRAHAGIKRTSRSAFRTNKDGPYRQKMDGTLIERATGRVLREGRR